MVERLTKISENSYISVGLLISVIAGVFWISTYAAELKETRRQVEEYATTVKSIDQRLARIEGKLEGKWTSRRGE